MAGLDQDNARRKLWESFLFLLVLVMVSWTWMFGDVSVPNERSRLYLAVALVDHGTVQIDEPIRQWGKIYDLAEKDGHYYSDKAPGSSFLGAAVYFVATLFKPAAEWRVKDLINLMRTWLMIPITMLGFFFLRRILRYLGVDPPVIDIVTLAWLLGTAAFHYGAAYFGHQIVAVALLAALWFVLVAEDWPTNLKHVRKWSFAAGVAAGIAGMTEYQAAVPCVLLVGYVAAGDARLRNHGLPMLLLGAAPFAAALFWYNDAAFGGPLELSYHYLADPGLREIHGQGIAGVTVPSWEYFSGSMFSLHRGLFTTAPLFLFALWGLWVMWDEVNGRLAALIGLTLLYFVAFVSSSNMWFAGWGFGPRLLVPGMGLWSIAVALGVQAAQVHPVSDALARGFAAVQIAYTQVVVAYFPEPPDSTRNPLHDVVPVMRAEGIASPNLGQNVLGMSASDSMTVILGVTVVAVGIVVMRGMRTMRWPNRGIVLAGVVASHLLFATIVSAVGPTWDDAQRQKWVRLIKRWDAREVRKASSVPEIEAPELGPAKTGRGFRDAQKAIGDL